MKTTIAILMCLTSLVMKAQETTIPLTQLGSLDETENVTYYYKDINGDLDKFLGTWKYQVSGKELFVKFYKNVHRESGGTYYDDIYAKFKYTENGIVIYNTLLDTSESSKYKIFGGSIFEDSLNEISVSYFEPTNIPYKGAVNPRLNLEFLPCTTMGCSPQLKWDIFWVRNKDSEQWPFKIPSSLVLTKQ